MKMNMKDNKMMLALVVVAALAMVSVAGVALATNDDSDAASASTVYVTSDSYTEVPVTIAATTYTGDIYVYSALYYADETLKTAYEPNVLVTIRSDATFTGHIYFGTAIYDSAGQVTAYEVYNDVELTSVSNVTVQVTTMYGYDYTTTITGSTTGTVTVAADSALVVGDAMTSTSFSGKIVAGDASFEALYVAGPLVSVVTDEDDVQTTYVAGFLYGCINDIVDVESGLITLTAADLPKFVASGEFTINDSIYGVFSVDYAVFEITEGSVATLYYGSYDVILNEGTEDETTVTYYQSSVLNIGTAALVVEGTLNVVDMSGSSSSYAINNYGIISVSGMINYVTDGTAWESSPIYNEGLLSASYYNIVTYVDDDDVDYVTHHYTSFANAIANSEDSVTVYGVNVITEDIEITKEVIISDDAVIIIGIPDVQVDLGDALSTLLTSDELGMVTDAMAIFGLTENTFEPSYATVTVDADASLIAYGDVIVLNGIITVDSDATIYDEGITATVSGMEYNGNTIYTNLETALDLFKTADSDPIYLSWTAYLFSDSTIASGVTVANDDGNDYSLIVYCGVTLTINGTLDLGDADLYLLPGVDATVSRNGETLTASLDAATLNLNSGTLIADDIYLGGEFNVASGYNNVSGDDYFEVDNIYVFSLDISGTYGTLTVEGYSYVIDVEYTLATTSVAELNVAGALNLGDATVDGADVVYTITDDTAVGDEYDGGEIIVTVTGTLVSGAFTNAYVDTDFAISGSYVSTAVEYVDIMTVATTGSVTEFGGTLNVGEISSGTAATSFSGVANGAVIRTTGTIGYAAIYGITDAGAISFATNNVTEFYISDGVLYLTLFTSDAVYYESYYSPSVPGYNFLGWYDDNGQFVTKYTLTNNYIGEFPNLYASFEAITYTVTLEYQANGYWMVNNVNYGNGGTVTLDWASSYTITFVAYDGYYWDGTVLANGTPVTSTYVPTNGDYLTLSPAVVASTITLGYTQHGYWVVNDVTYLSGTVNVSTANATKITFVAESGYELKNSSIYVNGTQKSSSSTLTYTAAAGDTVTFGGAVDQKVVDDSGLSVTDILLIVITIVIIIIAIIVALRLMRS